LAQKGKGGSTQEREKNEYKIAPKLPDLTEAERSSPSEGEVGA